MVRVEVLKRRECRLLYDREVLEDIAIIHTIDKQQDLDQILSRSDRVSWRLMPQTCLLIVCRTYVAKSTLALGVLIEDQINIVLLTLAILIRRVVVEGEGDICDVARLKHIPVVVGDTVYDNLIGKLLQYGVHLWDIAVLLLDILKQEVIT